MNLTGLGLVNQRKGDTDLVSSIAQTIKTFPVAQPFGGAVNLLLVGEGKICEPAALRSRFCRTTSIRPGCHGFKLRGSSDWLLAKIGISSDLRRC